MSRLVLIRHGESVWNKENLFTGWTDVELSETGIKEAKEAGRLLQEGGYQFDICFTSFLKRAIHTLNYTLEGIDQEYLPVEKTWRLNERHYGALQGLNKAETAEKYGEDQVKIWRRSFAVRPPELDENDPRNPALQKTYATVDKKDLPLAESLKDTIARVLPFYESKIKPEILKGHDVLVTAHGNSLRALIMYLENITEEDIIGLNLPTGVPYVYEMDGEANILSKKYLGDQEAIASKMASVANQGKKQ